MKNLFTAILLGMILVGVSFAQTRNRSTSRQKPTLAVLEFGSQASLPYWTWETSASFQRNLIKELTGSFAVAPAEETTAIVRGQTLTSAIFLPATEENAVKIGKLLGVNYVLFGEVTEFAPGRFAIKTSLAKLKTHSTVVIRIDYFDETNPNAAKGAGTGTLTLTSSSANLVMKPVIQKLTASLKAADL